MKQVALGEIATIHGGGRLKLSGKDFVDAGVPAYGAGGRNGYVATTEYERPGVILSSIGARCGKCFFVDGRWTTLANTQVILPDLTRVDPRFLWYQLNDEDRWPRSGTGQPFIKPSDVKSHIVALPPIEEQRRITAILDQADALRAKRRKALTLLNDLIQAIFIDMFGTLDREMSDSSGERFRDHVASLQGGRNLVGADPSAISPFRVLKISAVTSGVFLPQESKPLPPDYVPNPMHLVRAGDLLMSRANTTEMVGATALVRDTPLNVALPDKLWRLAWKDPDRVEPVYMHALLQQPAVRRALSARSSGTGGSMKNISKAKLMEMPFPVAPLAEQRKFTESAARVNLVAEKSRGQLETLEVAFAALQTLAFSGRL